MPNTEVKLIEPACPDRLELERSIEALQRARFSSEHIQASGTALRQAASRLLELGWPVIPIWGAFSVHPSRGKAPRGTGWQHASDHRAYLKQHLYPGDNLGVVGGGEYGIDEQRRPLYVVWLDVDFDDEAAAAAARSAFPRLLVRVGKAPKFAVLVRTAEPWSRDFKFRHQDGRTITLQILGRSRDPAKGPKQAIVWGVHPATHKPYQWEGDQSIFDLKPTELPVVGVEQLLETIAGVLEPLGWKRQTAADTQGRLAPQRALGPMSEAERERLVIWGRDRLAHACNKLQAMAPGSGRGTAVHELAMQLSPLVAVGVMAVQECERAISNATDWAAVERDFYRGLAVETDQLTNLACKELRAARQFLASVASFAASAQVPGEAVSAAGLRRVMRSQKASEVNRPDGREASEIAMQLDSLVFNSRDILVIGQYGHLAAAWADTAAKVAEGIIFRSTVGGRIVRVAPSAGHRELENAKADGFDLSRILGPAVAEDEMSRAALSNLLRDVGRFWQPVPVPHNEKPITRSMDGTEVSWEETVNRKPIKIVAKTRDWAIANAFNFEQLELVPHEPDSGIEMAWVAARVPKGAVAEEATERLIGGIGRASTWKMLQVATAPCLAPGGVPLVKDGFTPVREGEGIFVALGHLRGHVNVPSDDTLRDPVTGPQVIDNAKGLLCWLIDQFPYADQVSRSVTLAMFLTLVARPAFTLSPAFLIDAPEYGTGKTFLAAMLASIAGLGVEVIACGAENGGDEEIQKRFETSLLCGAVGLVVLDDVPNSRVPNFSSIRSFLTSEQPVSIRVMGRNDRRVQVEPTRTVIAITGNNLTTSRDMVRRCVRLYLDRHPADERGWSKENAEANLHRLLAEPDALGRVISAVLTVLRYNLLLRPCRQSKAAENYEGWSAIVREACIFVTGADPLRSQELLKAEDPDREKQADTLARLAQVVGVGTKFTAGDIADRVQGLPPFGAIDPSIAALTAIKDEFGWQNGRQQFNQRLAGWLRRHKSRTFETDRGKLRIERFGAATQNNSDRGAWLIQQL